jgi:hypothetical protein
MQAGSSVGMHTLDQDLRRLVEDGTIAANVARSFAVDPRTLDDVRVRSQDLDVEAWSLHAGEWHQPMPGTGPNADATVGTGLGMGSRFGTPVQPGSES